MLKQAGTVRAHAHAHTQPSVLSHRLLHPCKTRPSVRCHAFGRNKNSQQQQPPQQQEQQAVPEQPPIDASDAAAAVQSADSYQQPYEEQDPGMYDAAEGMEQGYEEQGEGYEQGYEEQGAASTAEATAGTAQQQQQGGAEVQETEEVEEPITLRTVVTDFPSFVRDSKLGKGVALAGLLLVGGTFYVAVQRYWAAYTSPQATRSRQVNKNKLLVEELSQLLPKSRKQLTPGKIRSLQAKTRFNSVEIFRKYLWFTLRERSFDQTAVDDILALRDACGLSDDDVAEALRERAQRIYDKYGTLMLNTEGMTPEGIERKATCQNLFRKLLFLTEYEPLVKQDGGATVSADLRKIFGATDEDVERLRIVSLFDVDLEKAFGMQASTEQGAPAEELNTSSSSPQPPKQDEPPQQKQEESEKKH